MAGARRGRAGSTSPAGLHGRRKGFGPDAPCEETRGNEEALGNTGARRRRLEATAAAAGHQVAAAVGGWVVRVSNPNHQLK